MIRQIAIWAALSGAAFFLGPARADAPSLRFPLDCDLGEDCFIQQYMDRDPGPGARDHTCGPLSYDGHTGTDIRVMDLSDLARDIPVFAAAPGIVIGLRNSTADDGRDGMVAGQECGNGVLLDHGQGWQTQYCHMRRGSVSVTEGQSVAEGAPLGLMGYSGNTEFPHLHISVRRDGEDVDPFSVDGSCGAAGESLWQAPLPYQPGGFLTAGFATDIPAFDSIRAGTAGLDRIAPDAPALVIWAYLFGARAGDELRLLIRLPDGDTLHDVTVPLDRTEAQLFRATGLRARGDTWTEGGYSGEVRLIRDGTEIDRITAETRIAR